MEITRREICAMFPALLLPATPSALPTDAKELPSAMYPFEAISPRKLSTHEVRDILKGKLATGELVEVHETTLPPGGAPHPPHRHVHSEMWLIREGTVELTVEGKSTHLGPGSLGIVRSNEVHGIKNTSGAPATYFVVAIGPGSA